VSAILALTVENSIATLVLDRPAVGNTIDMSLARALVDATVRCDEDEAIRCVVLTGRGRLFCGGGDVSAFAGAGDDLSAFLRELAGVLHEAISRLMRMKKTAGRSRQRSGRWRGAQPRARRRYHASG